MADEIYTVIGISLTVIGIVLGVVYRYSTRISTLEEKITTLEGDIKDMQKQVAGNTVDLKQLIIESAKNQTKMDLFWGALEDQLPGLLLKGNPLAPDSRVAQLLTKYQKKEIDVKTECPELIQLLHEEANRPDHDPGEKIAMVLTIAVIKATMDDQCRAGSNITQ